MSSSLLCTKTRFLHRAAAAGGVMGFECLHFPHQFDKVKLSSVCQPESGIGQIYSPLN